MDEWVEVFAKVRDRNGGIRHVYAGSVQDFAYDAKWKRWKRGLVLDELCVFDRHGYRVEFTAASTDIERDAGWARVLDSKEWK